MGTQAVRRREPRRTQRRLNGLVVAGVIVVLLLALVGLVSAGAFIAGKVGGSASTTKRHAPSGRSVAVQDVTRAQAEATAIVNAGQQASQNLVKAATTDAKRKANKIVAEAKKKAQDLVHRAQATAPVAAAPQPVTSGPVSTVPVSPSTAPYTPTSPTSGLATGSSTAGTPNLRGVPASWLVVAYNANFGSGPGNAGGISVVNRGKRFMSGTATVKYASGGTAQAFFSGIAPGQSIVLPLNGKRYIGGGFAIQVSNVR